jgi:DNA-binding MarR family transcriptional regulator
MYKKVKKINDAFHSYHCSHRNIIDTRFREKGIYFGQPPILKYLSEHENATQKEIAEFLHISPPSVATSLKRMEESGLVIRIESKKDARSNVVRLTKKGKELNAFAENTFMRIDDVAYKGFTEEEMDLMVSFLERMNENLTKFIKEEDYA